MDKYGEKGTKRTKIKDNEFKKMRQNHMTMSLALRCHHLAQIIYKTIISLNHHLELHAGNKI